MAILQFKQVSLAYGMAPLLDKASLVIEPGERLCLVGRNGTGKSSLLKLISGDNLPDSGTIWRRDGLKIARLEQDPPRNAAGTVFEFVAQGLAELGDALTRWQQVNRQLADPEHDHERVMAQLARLQTQIESLDGWRFEQRIQSVMTRMALDGEADLASLSGGWLRRAALARALVTEPDLLLLDEPTNHLDLETIDWLETELLAFQGCLVFVSHDRAFIRRMATRIIDMDRGQLASFPGDYDKYLTGKEELLRVEAEQNALFDKKLAEEEVWIRQGIKARRTRNEGRVRALEALRRERKARLEQQGRAKARVEQGGRSGKLVCEVTDLCYQIEEKQLVSNLSLTVMRGDRIALIGPNGVGKTTLLRLLLGQLKPQQGTVEQGTNLEVAYFDQHRSALDPEKSVVDNVADGRVELEINGQKRHVLGYLQDFLFTPQRARTPVKALSGGERNRLLLARTFLKPSNLLIMDEPTNDLDLETMELLEDLLEQYQGTLLLVSHDREFIDKTATSTLVFSGDGVINEYVGGYSDWLRYRQAVAETAPPVREKETAKESRPASRQRSKTKLSYKESRELEQLPAQLESLEQEIDELQQQVSDPGFYRQDEPTVKQILASLESAEQALEQAFERWEALEALRDELEGK